MTPEALPIYLVGIIVLVTAHGVAGALVGGVIMVAGLLVARATRPWRL